MSLCPLFELGVQNQWSKFGNFLSAMSTRMSEINWEQTIYNRWEAALRELCVAKDARQPYFMKTSQWDKKNLNAALASWAELKHDAILYAKQPFGAECGGGDDLPSPPLSPSRTWSPISPSGTRPWRLSTR